MIKPINDHVLIEPVKHESFMFSERETYDEVGTVIDFDIEGKAGQSNLSLGDKVYFDSWLASKFPKNDTEFWWLVPFGSIKAYEPLPVE